MTAFDNIKANNWPATSNELEDFLVLELPLNDAASLTESRRDIVAGGTVLYPKRTLTNAGVKSVSNPPGFRIWSSALDSSNTNNLPFRASKTIADAFKPTPVQVETGSNGSGRVIWLDFASNGGAITGSTLLIVGAGFTASMRDVYFNGSSTKAGNIDETLNISGTTINSIQIKSNASNAGAGFAGIELDGVRLIDSSRKHYDNNAVLAAGSSNYLQTVGLASVSNTDYTYECYAKADGAIGNLSLFHTNQTTRGGILALFTSATNIQLYFGPGGNWTSNHNIAVNIDAAWHHYAVVRQNGGDVSLYMDGILKGAVTTPGAHTHGELVIGRQSGDNNLYWNGAVQDFRIYRTAKYTSNFTPPPAILG